MTTTSVRKMVTIDEEKCTGCGNCIISCAEGALEIIDGKARLISDKYCDGLGNCLDCPEGAITLRERDAEAFDEAAVEEHLNTQEKTEGLPARPSRSPNSIIRPRRRPRPPCPARRRRHGSVTGRCS